MRERARPYLLLAPTWLLLTVFLLAPLAMIFVTSFARRAPQGGVQPVTDVWAHLSSGAFLANYARTFDPIYLPIFWRSLWLAAVTTGLCLLIAYPVAYHIALVAPKRWKNALLALAVIPFWTSFLIRTYAWMFILRAEGFANTALLKTGLIDAPLDLLYNNFAVLVGLVYGALPFMILPLYASLEKFDRTLLEAATDLGASRLQTFGRITLPLTAPGIAIGVLLVFVPSIGQFIVPDLLGGARTQLVGNLIQNQFTTSRNPPFGSALAFELTAFVLLLLLAYALYVRRRGQEAS